MAQYPPHRLGGEAALAEKARLAGTRGGIGRWGRELAPPDLLGALELAALECLGRLGIECDAVLGQLLLDAQVAVARCAGVDTRFGEALLPRTALGWANLIGLGLVVQVGGQGLIAYGVGRLPIVASTVLLWMQPLVAAVLSWILFDETLGALALLGAALILGGIYVVQRYRA